MKIFKKIGVRIVVIIGLLVAFNFIYSTFFLKHDILKEADIANILPSPKDSAQILYLAESSNFTFDKHDLDERTISKLFAAYYPSKKVFTINKGALHSGIYKILLHQIPKNNQVETVIVTLNLRSFGADWIYSKLETSLQKSIVLLKPGPPLINRILLSFKGYDVKTDSERYNQVIQHWKHDELNIPYNFDYKSTLDWEQALNKKGFWFNDGNKDYDKTALACHYVKSYAFTISPDNPRVKDFDQIVDYCNERGWNVVFNLLAENTQKAQELVGADLIFLMNRNREFLLNRYQSKGVLVVDNLDNVDTKYYIDQNWTTEHYTEEGRHIIAKNVAESLKQMYPNDFVEQHFNRQSQTSVFNNYCEGETHWANNTTITKEKAFEGKLSCKTDELQPYSLTFQSPLKQIPDSTKNLLAFKVMSLQTNEINPAKAVVELQGDGIQTKWIIQSFSNFQVGEWHPNQFTFNLSDIELSNYNLIKVYCSNKSKEPIYLDNFEIEFK